MTDPAVSPELAGSVDDTVVERPAKASILTVIRDQRKTITVALVLAIGSYWFAGQFGEWRLATRDRGRCRPRPGQPPGHRVLAAAHHRQR